ncbi:xylose isomerase, partial [Vibrio breoganii]
PNSVEENTLVMYEILKAGGFTTGGFNFDARLRRPSIDAEDLFHGHIGGMDVMAKSLENAAAMLENDVLGKLTSERYASWNDDLGKKILGGEMNLEQVAKFAQEKNIAPKMVSGRQEHLENIVNNFIYK